MKQMDSEKELVLGNKQLVSFFFVVLALCGVFFALGYMIGRNSSKTGAASLDGTPAVAADTNPRASEPEPAHEVARPENSAPAEPPPPTTQTQPARDNPVASPETPRSFTPEPGASYLQVAAQRRADAENLVKTLREQSFPAILADSSKPDLFRVLVGPYRKTADVADAKSRLKVLGFANAFVLK